jgi:hypothetical protein
MIPGYRVEVIDAPGESVRLTLDGETGTVAMVELDPTRAVALDGELIDAALPGLSRE